MFVEQALRRYVGEGPVVMLDLCAAPGGKSTHARSVLPAGSLLVANEVIATARRYWRRILRSGGIPVWWSLIMTRQIFFLDGLLRRHIDGCPLLWRGGCSVKTPLR